MSLKVTAPIWRSLSLPSLLSMLIFFGATALLFRSWEFGLVVTASLGFHEFGHAAALIFHRLNWRIHFGLVGAWTWSQVEQRERLSPWANASIHLAGPFFSLVLALLALIVHALWRPESRHLLVLANFSAQVGFLNLLPFGPITDGGKIIRRIIESLGSGVHRRWFWLPIVIILVVVVLTLYILVQLPYLNHELHLLLGMLLVGLWMTGSLWWEAVTLWGKPSWRAALRQAMPAPPAEPGAIPVTGVPAASNGRTGIRPMTARQVALLTLLVWDMLTVYLLIISVTPFWLEPDYVYGTIENILWVSSWLAP